MIRILVNEILLVQMPQYLLMGRKPTKCPKKCPKHVLIFKPNHHSTNFPREVQISFCPSNLKQHPVFPIFNRDGKHYTSSFTLHDEKDKYETNDQLYRRQHERFCREQLQGKSKMLEPKPRSKNQYCHVCKEHYQDYLKHIIQPIHKKSIGKNKFSEHIGNLINTYFPEKKESELANLPDKLTVNQELTLVTQSTSAPAQNIQTPDNNRPSNIGYKMQPFEEVIPQFEYKAENMLIQMRESPHEEKKNLQQDNQRIPKKKPYHEHRTTVANGYFKQLMIEQ